MRGDVLGKAVKEIINTYTAKNKFTLTAGSLKSSAAENLEDGIVTGVSRTIKLSARKLNKELGITGPTDTAKALRQANIDQVVGNIFESILSFAGVPFGGGDTDPPNAPLDFPKGLSPKVAGQFGLQGGIPTEAKSSFTNDALSTFNRKIRNFNLDEAKTELLGVFAKLGRELSTTEFGNITGGKSAEESTIAARRRGFNVRQAKVQQANLFALSRRASGGVISNFNTGGEVPVRISNGEMVVTNPKEVAARRGELQRINKLSTGGFASGYILWRS